MNDAAQTIERLAHRLGSALRAQHLTLATAESCTAGGVAYAITIVPGSSGWYDRGFITYSNEAKMQMLGRFVCVFARLWRGQRAGGARDGARSVVARRARVAGGDRDCRA